MNNRPTSTPSIAMKQVPPKLWVVLAVSVPLVLSIMVAAFSNQAVGSPTQPDPSTAPSMVQTEHADSDVQDGFAHVVKTVRPAVVNITVSHVMATGPSDGALRGFPDRFGHGPWGNRFFEMPFPNPPRAPRSPGMGTGVIVHPDGYVVTNHHVVDGAKTVTVTLPDQQTFAGTIVGTDPQTDLAVIRVEGRNLPFIPWGDSSRLEVGDYVLAVGNPFGLNSTVTQGIVSAKGRGGMGITQYEDFIQTDAAINPGNSGGALVNVNGELVGINTAIVSRTGGYQGVGFAVPANMAKHVHDSLVAEGKVVRGYLGVGIQGVTPNLVEVFQLDGPTGAIVTDVRDQSPADRAGLQRGDAIIEYQGEPIADPRALQRAVTTTPVGTEVTILIVREGKRQTLHGTIIEHPVKPRVASGRQPDSESTLSGVTVQELTPYVAQRLGVDRRTTGVVVTDVRAGSRAEESGLTQGDVIREVNRQPVESLKEYRQVVQALPKDQSALLFIHRQGVPLFLTVKT